MGSRLTCTPIWFLKNGAKPGINCPACFWRKNTCGLEASDFNISSLPKIEETDVGKQNRSARTKNTPRVKEEANKTELNKVPQAQGSARRPKKAPATKNEGEATVPKKTTASKGKKKELTLGPAFFNEFVPSRTVSLTLPALSTYERFLNDPHRSILSLDEGLTQLEETFASEESFSENLYETIRQRGEIKNELVKRFEVAIASERAKNDCGEGSSKGAAPQK